jgi:uncharacterized membrane protein
MLDALLSSAPLIYLTQSVWRDEAYSILIAQKPLSTYVQLSFEPPLYYTLLHVWIQILGTSEVAVRGLSVLAFIVAIFFMAKIAVKLFGKSWVAWYLPLFFALNPMLLYYAFEARSYGLYIAFTVMSTYFYLEKKWFWYTITSTLGLYTHAYMVFVLITQVLHYLSTQVEYRQVRIKKFLHDPMFLSGVAMLLLYSPWLTKMYLDIPRLKQSWYFPVDMQLFKSVLGNIFLGYEGTPWNLWKFTARVSVVIFLITMGSMLRKHNRSISWYFLILLYLPLFVILTASVYKPLYVMRYMIPSTIAEIVLIVIALQVIPNRMMQKVVAAVLLCFVIGFSAWNTKYHKKIDMRNTIAQINALQRENDVILVDDALMLYESMYYNTSKSPVYWYNPRGDAFPWYIGDYVITSSQIVKDVPPYPQRGFLIHLDGTYKIVYNAPISVKPPGYKK